MCILLYDERVNTWHRMREIDVLLDDRPELAREMVELDNRNRLANKELQVYNDHKVFVYKHPILKEKKLKNEILTELLELKQSNPEAFVKECYNIVKGLNRYKNLLSNDKFSSDEEKLRCMENVDKYSLRHSIVQTIIK
jgi:hypothetical protein